MRISDWSSDVCSSDLDTYGHAAGDIVLCRVADILERIVRRTDLVARPGGDEFTIVLVGIDNISKIEQIAQTIIDEVRKPLDIGNALQVQIRSAKRSVGKECVSTGRARGSQGHKKKKKPNKK